MPEGSEGFTGAPHPEAFRQVQIQCGDWILFRIWVGAVSTFRDLKAYFWPRPVVPKKGLEVILIPVKGELGRVSRSSACACRIPHRLRYWFFIPQRALMCPILHPICLSWPLFKAQNKTIMDVD